MKIILSGGAALALLAGCAGISDKTGLTTEEQVCIINQVSAVEKAGEIEPSLELATTIAAACGIDLTQFVMEVISTALASADLAEE